MSRRLRCECNSLFRAHRTFSIADSKTNAPRREREGIVLGPRVAGTLFTIYCYLYNNEGFLGCERSGREPTH